MKKIIMAFDGEHFSEGAFELARKLNELTPILLTGVFVREAELAVMWSYADGVPGYASPIVEGFNEESVQKTMQLFEKRCLANGIDFRIHRDTGDEAIKELKLESEFADLMILGSEVFYKDLGTDSLNDYLERVLFNIKCPVIIVPEIFEFPEGIILAYDGTDNSIFAIKQFAYLFPELTSRPAMLVFASPDKKQDFPNRHLIEELAVRHYRDLTLHKMDVKPGEYLNTWLIGKESVILVCGAYGRSGLSHLFRKSFVREVIASHSLPVFIDHR